MYTYKLTATGRIQRSDGVSFPVDSSCNDYLIYQEWRLLGNTPFPADPLPVEPLPLRAQALLDKSDITMLRCVEAGVAVPPAWNTYRKALRAIATGQDKTSTALPATPAFVAGT